MADEASGDRGRRKRDAPQKAIEGASEQAGKATKGAKAKPTKDATGPKKEPKAATNRGKGQKEANEVGASGGAGAKEPEEDIKALYDVPECPVFFPTAKEFNHPGKYIESISEQVRPFGICKIVPPPTWKPPFMIDPKAFTVRTRVQQVNYLDGQARQRLIFVENLCRFWLSKRGQELNKLPVIAKAPLDVCRLFHVVKMLGGMAAVTAKKMWADVARSMEMEGSHGSALRAQYVKMLLPYEEWKAEQGEYNAKQDEEVTLDPEEMEARQQLEKRARQEKEERERRKRERAAQFATEQGARRSARDRRPVDRKMGQGSGAKEDEDDAGSWKRSDAITFKTESGVISVGSKVSVFWDGDGVHYKGTVVRTCERKGCKVLYEADGEIHWEDPESLQLLDGTGGVVDELGEGDLPLLDSVGGQAALEDFDACLGVGSDVAKAVLSVVKSELSHSERPEASPGMGSGDNSDWGKEADTESEDEDKSDAPAGTSNTLGNAFADQGKCAKKGSEEPSSAMDVDVKTESQEVISSCGASATTGIISAAQGGALAPVSDNAQPSSSTAEIKAGHWERGEDGKRVWVAADDSSGEVKHERAGQDAGSGDGERKVGREKALGKMSGGKVGGPGGNEEVESAPGEGEQEHEEEEGEYRFGYHDGSTYTLHGFRKMANEWKENHFQRSLRRISEDDVEEEYWRVVSDPEKQVSVEYGSELHTTRHGSGFPTHGNALNPLDGKTSSGYCRSGWNLNNLNMCTLLRFVKEDIPGILSPWLYMGMCFSSFCWHNEDHFLYSINYLWEGDPKQWYGVSGDKADDFEAALREYAPQLFELQPDVLFQLVTMIAPSRLRDKGIFVCRARQCAGEFMVTFPRAYHGGFNTGYNVAESCNFALPDWIPWGLMSDRWYRQLGRPQVFSHVALLVSLAEDISLNLMSSANGIGPVETAMWLVSDLERCIALEQQGVSNLCAAGLTERKRMRMAAGVLTQMLSNGEKEEQSTTDGKRLCAGRSNSSHMSMQDMRRQRESQGEDECCICLGSTFLFLVRCKCCMDSSRPRVSCVEHAQRMCECPMASKTLEARFSDTELSQLVRQVRQVADRPALWLRHVQQLLAHETCGPETPRGEQKHAAEDKSGARCESAPARTPVAKRPSVRTLHALVLAAESFPRNMPAVSQQQEALKDVLQASKAWAAQASVILQAVKKQPKGSRGVAKESCEEFPHSVADLQKLIQETEELRAVPEEELQALQELLDSVHQWRDRYIAAAMGAPDRADPGRQALHSGGRGGLGQLDDPSLLELLADGRALRVQTPELRKVKHEVDLRAWISALPPIPGTCSMQCVQDLVAQADENVMSRGGKLQGSLVDTMRSAKASADAVRSRVHKSRGRGASLVALKAVLIEIVKGRESAQEKGELVIELEEEVELANTIKLCEAWSARCVRMLGLPDRGDAAAGLGDGASKLKLEDGKGEARPLCSDLERMQEEYHAMGVYLEVSDVLRRSLDFAQAWKRKALRIASSVLNPPDFPGSVSSESFVAKAGSDNELTRDISVELSGADRTEDTDWHGQQQDAAVGGKRKRHSEPLASGKETEESSKKSRTDKDKETRHQKKEKEPGNLPLPTQMQVVELLAEEACLKVHVELADILSERLRLYATWVDQAKALLAKAESPAAAFQSMLSASFASVGGLGADASSGETTQNMHEFKDLLQKGEALCVQLGEEGRKVRIWLWAVRVARLLAAGTGKYGADREQLIYAQKESTQLCVQNCNEILTALKLAIQVLETQGCVCGSSKPRLFPEGAMLTCAGCHKNLHTCCLNIHAADTRISSAALSFMCAPCRRQGKMVQGADAWTRDVAVSLKLPPLWTQTNDPVSGSLLFVQQDSNGNLAQVMRTPPETSVAVIACDPNDCLARQGDTKDLCQVCFEIDEVVQTDVALSAADRAEQERVAKLVQEAARERGKMLECLECGVRVHQGCYFGSLKEPAQSSDGSIRFLCRPCEFAVRRAACVLCGLTGGAMIPATCGGWAHVACALWAPKGSGIEFEECSGIQDRVAKDGEGGAGSSQKAAAIDEGKTTGTDARQRHRVFVPDSFPLSPIVLGDENAAGNDKRRSTPGSEGISSNRGAVCRLCPKNTPGGVLVKCQEKKCRQVAHPVCAFEHGWYLYAGERGGHDDSDAQAGSADVHDQDKCRNSGRSGTFKRAPKARRKETDRLQKKQKDEEDRLIFCAMHAPQEEEEDDTLYCICQRKYQEGEWMIECEACEGWFHGSCVGVKQEESHLLVDWRCPSCRPHSVPMDVDDGEMQKSKELVVA